MAKVVVGMGDVEVEEVWHGDYGYIVNQGPDWRKECGRFEGRRRFKFEIRNQKFEWYGIAGGGGWIGCGLEVFEFRI
jgi:hypothetical protein